MLRKTHTYSWAVVLIGMLTAVLYLQACKDISQVTGAQDRVKIQQDTMTVYTVKLTGVTLHPIDKNVSNGRMSFSWSDTLNNQLKFEAVPQYVKLDSTVITKPVMEDRTSYEVVNPVTSTKADARFNFNKPIVFRDLRIQAGKNFLADSILSRHVDFPLNLRPGGRGQLELDMNHFFIPPRKYTVMATWKTEKGEIFTDSTRVFINLGQ